MLGGFLKLLPRLIMQLVLMDAGGYWGKMPQGCRRLRCWQGFGAVHLVSGLNRCVLRQRGRIVRPGVFD